MPWIRSPALRYWLLLFLPLVTATTVLFLHGRGEAGAAPTPVPVSMGGNEPERLVFLLEYVAADYAGAVDNGTIVNEIEYDEMLAFTSALVEGYAAERGAERDAIAVGLDELRRAVGDRAPADDVRRRATSLLPDLTAALGVVLQPLDRPDVVAGARLWAEGCAVCHGMNGDGDGTAAATLDPPPTSFRGPRIDLLSPHQVFSAVTFGVAGTGMPSFAEAYTSRERWDLAFHVMTLRESFAPRPPRATGMLSLGEIASSTDADLQGLLRVRGGDGDRATVDWYRLNAPATDSRERLAGAVAAVDASLRAYEAGQVDSALAQVTDGYLFGIEPLEAVLRPRSPRTVDAVEREFAAYRTVLRHGKPVELAASHAERLVDTIEAAGEHLGPSSTSRTIAFVQALTILLREGVEAALLLGVMVACLTSMGSHALRRWAVVGAVAGVVAGLLTWFAAGSLLRISAAQQEIVEGLASLLAAGVLFTVCVWIIHHAEIGRWKTYLQSKARASGGGGGAFAIGAASFLAVYREAFETVLFLQALWVRGPELHGALLLGLGAGSVLLAGIVAAILVFGVRIPLKPFFRITGVVLAMLAFSFVGHGIRELQVVGWIDVTPLPWFRDVAIPALQPTLEGLALQLGLLLSLAAGWLVPVGPRTAPG
jgi:high-affinity iron transporter